MAIKSKNHFNIRFCPLYQLKVAANDPSYLCAFLVSNVNFVLWHFTFVDNFLLSMSHLMFAILRVVHLMLLHLSKFNLLPTVSNLSRGNSSPLKMFSRKLHNVSNIENVYLGNFALTAAEVPPTNCV